MYLKFFVLSAKPFNLTPDPKFLYLGKSHQESYAQLFYGVNENAGFVVLIGEEGTGKTTICRSFLGQLPEDCNLAYIFNPDQDEIELLRSLNKELGLRYDLETKKGLQDLLYQYLLGQEKAAKRVILLIDEAQNLTPQVLEQIRLLSNLETETKKLMQIILVGQPELDDLLNSHPLRQLRQRVSVWCRLAPLSYVEMVEYINHRMEMAGGKQLNLFSDRVLREIYNYSKGFPRLTNLVCDRALLAAYSRGERALNVDTIKKVISDVDGSVPKVEGRRKGFKYAVPAAAAAVVGLLLAFGSWTFGKPVSPVVEAPKPAAEAPKPEPDKLEAPPEGAALQPAPQQATEQFFSNDSRNAALNSVFEKWGVPEKAGAADEPLMISEIARKRNMNCYIGNLDVTALKKFNYPAILILSDENGRKGFLPVTGFKDDGFVAGSNGQVVSQQWALKYWRGATYIMWRDFWGDSIPLKRGVIGDNVKLLQIDLEKIGYLKPGDDDGKYGIGTVIAVQKFQGDSQLPADGMAGETTKMMLFSLNPMYKTPRLL